MATPSLRAAPHDQSNAAALGRLYKQTPPGPFVWRIGEDVLTAAANSEASKADPALLDLKILCDPGAITAAATYRWNGVVLHVVGHLRPLVVSGRLKASVTSIDVGALTAPSALRDALASDVVGLLSAIHLNKGDSLTSVDVFSRYLVLEGVRSGPPSPSPQKR